MVAAASQLPDLSPLDHVILSRLLEHDDILSLKDLLKSLTKNTIKNAPTSLAALYQWSIQDHIRAWLDFHDSQLSAAIRRRRIAKLEQIADTSKDLVEQRRACTTILRHLTQPFARRVTIHDRAGASLPRFLPEESPNDSRAGPHSSVTRTVPAPVPHARSAPSEPRSSGSGTLQPTAAPIPDQSALQAAPEPVHLLTCSPVHPSRDNSEPTRQPASSPIHPSTHSPLHASPDPLLELVISHIQIPRDPASIAALAGALAPNATINNTPAAGRAQIALATLPIPPSTLTAIDPPLIESTDDLITWSSTFTYATGDRSHFQLQLSRTDTLWQITSLTHQLNSS